MADDLAETLLAFAESLADESRAMLQAATRQAHSITLKSDASFVTTTDRAIEARLRERIAATFPGHGILGEEFGADTPDADLVWVLDPIDGTAAFIAGIPVYGTLIGVARGGLPWIGVTDHPVTNERLTGITGRFARHNGTDIRCRGGVGLPDAFMTSSNPRFLNKAQAAAVRELDGAVQFTQYGGSCYAYGCLARGQTDLAVDAGLEAFDVFAPVAIILGAGGIATDWHDNPVTLDWRGGILASGDRRLHDQALARLSHRPETLEGAKTLEGEA